MRAHLAQQAVLDDGDADGVVRVWSRCAIATTVRPWRTAPSDRSRCRAARGSNRDVASSRTRVCGSASTSRASASCWVCGGVSGSPPAAAGVSTPAGSASAHSSASTASSASTSSVPSRPTAQPEIVRERAHEDVLLLRDERHLAPESVEQELYEANPATSTLPVRGGWISEQPARRRLPRRRGRPPPHAPGPQVEVDAVQDVPVDDVRVPHVPRRSAPGRRARGRTRSGRAARTRCPRAVRVTRRRPGSRSEPRDEPVDRVSELLGVQDDRGHLADRCVTRLHQPPAPDEAGDDRQHVGDFGSREPVGAETKRVPLRLVGVGERRRAARSGAPSGQAPRS